jgi:hypothetical protein
VNNLPAFRVTCDNGRSWVTSMAAGTTLQAAKDYFIGTSFEQPDESTAIAIRVEQITDEELSAARAADPHKIRQAEAVGSDFRIRRTVNGQYAKLLNVLRDRIGKITYVHLADAKRETATLIAASLAKELEAFFTWDPTNKAGRSCAITLEPTSKGTATA